MKTPQVNYSIVMKDKTPYVNLERGRGVKGGLPNAPATATASGVKSHFRHRNHSVMMHEYNLSNLENHKFASNVRIS